MNSWSIYWIIWAAIAFVAFIIPETIAIVGRNVGNTLSANIWRLFRVEPGIPISQWTAAHVLFAVVWIGVSAWLVGHFVFGLWR